MKFSLLSISLLLTSSTAVSGVIPDLAKQFADQSETMIELVSELPTIFLGIFVVLSIFISRWIGDRKTVLIGLVMVLIGGLAPVFLNNFWMILVFRSIFGAGLGLFNPIAINLISKFFAGRERATLMGYQSAFQGAGAALLIFAAGQLLVFGWHTSFWVYAITLPILALFFCFVPNPPESGKKEKLSLNKTVLLMACMNFCIMILYNAIAVRLPDLIVEAHLGTATTASNLFSISQLATMVTGFIYIHIHDLLKRFTLPGAILTIGIGFVCIAFASNIWMAGIGAVLTGMGYGMLVPYLFNYSSGISTPAQMTLSTTMLIVAGQSAGFFAPLILDPLGNLGFLKNVYAQSFLSGSIILGVLTVAVLIFQEKLFPKSE